MNQKLSELYQAIYPELMAALATVPNLSKPLLIKVPDGYADTAIRLLVVGQETRGWGLPGVDGVAQLMDFYGETRNKTNTTILQAAKELFNGINPQGPELAFLWSNLIMLDQNGKRPNTTVEEVVSRFRLLPKEIEITKPDAVVFFIGPYYRSRLAATFPGIALQPAAPKISRAVHPQLPTSSFHTYHPGYLRRGNWHVITDLIRLICDDRNA